MKPNNVRAFLSPLKALNDLFNAAGITNIIIGGISASILGKARFTADIDALIILPEDMLESFVKKAAPYGFYPRIKEAEQFARKHRILLLKHKSSGINIDLSLALLPFEMEAFQRAMVLDTGTLKIHIPTPEDLIIMKAVAHRPADMEDIRAIVEANPALDRKHIYHWVKQFADVLEAPEILADLRKLLSVRKKK